LDSNPLRTQLVAAFPHIWRWAQFFIDAYLAAADGDEAWTAWAPLTAPFPFLHDDLRTADSVTFALKLWIAEAYHPAVRQELDAASDGVGVSTWRKSFLSAFHCAHARGEGIDPPSPWLDVVRKIFSDHEPVLVHAVFKHLAAVILGSSDCWGELYIHQNIVLVMLHDHATRFVARMLCQEYIV
jgi:hypothetical protein